MEKKLPKGSVAHYRLLTEANRLSQQKRCMSACTHPETHASATRSCQQPANQETLHHLLEVPACPHHNTANVPSAPESLLSFHCGCVHPRSVSNILSAFSLSACSARVALQRNYPVAIGIGGRLQQSFISGPN